MKKHIAEAILLFLILASFFYIKHVYGFEDAAIILLSLIYIHSVNSKPK